MNEFQFENTSYVILDQVNHKEHKERRTYSFFESSL